MLDAPLYRGLMTQNPIVFTFFLVFTGAALLATLALAARQSLLVAYIGLGILFGPWGLGLVADASLVRESAHIGIMFLLFLLGLDLTPQDLVHSLRRTTLVTAGNSVLMLVVGGAIGLAAGFTPTESLIIGAAMGFSSTIIGLKLLPTTVLHHQRMGESIISILLLQDLLAIVLLLLVQAAGTGNAPWTDMLMLLLSLPGLVLFSGLAARYLLIPLIRRYDTFREYIFLVAIGWCLGMAELAGVLGLSHEIGAFIAGVALASSPIALYIAESLRPLRDFFLVLFFFGVGVEFNLAMAPDVLVPGLLLAASALVLKPLVFRLLLVPVGETPKRAWEIGFRLGQLSEFTLLVAALAMTTGAIGERASYSLQLATVLTFLVSSYLVMLRFPTPIAISDALRRD